MPDVITCPKCDRKLRVPDELMGQEVKCPTCSTTFTASGTPPSPPPPPLPPREPEPEPHRVSPRRPGRRDDSDELDDYDNDDRPRRRRGTRPGRYLQPHRGSTILVLGILSLVILPIVFGPIAWIMGNNDMREIRAGRMDPEGEGNTNAGRICGMIGTILGIISIVCCIGWFALIIAGSAAGAGGARRF
jgi:predicted Zn finger-like uncharacterized protein